MAKLDDQISTLQDRLNRLKLRQQRVDSRKRAILAQRERKADTRRKILIGGVIAAKVQEGAIRREEFIAWMDDALLRTQDRALFSLPPKVDSTHRPVKDSR